MKRGSQSSRGAPASPGTSSSRALLASNSTGRTQLVGLTASMGLHVRSKKLLLVHSRRIYSSALFCSETNANFIESTILVDGCRCRLENCSSITQSKKDSWCSCKLVRARSWQETRALQDEHEREDGVRTMSGKACHLHLEAKQWSPRTRDSET